MCLNFCCCIPSAQQPPVTTGYSTGRNTHLEIIRHHRGRRRDGGFLGKCTCCLSVRMRVGISRAWLLVLRTSALGVWMGTETGGFLKLAGCPPGPCFRGRLHLKGVKLLAIEKGTGHLPLASHTHTPLTHTHMQAKSPPPPPPPAPAPPPPSSRVVKTKQYKDNLIFTAQDMVNHEHCVAETQKCSGKKSSL